jgi:cell division protein FtsN
MRLLILLLISSLIAACASQNQEPQVRFVNLQGKSRNLDMRYPEKNLEVLNKKPPSEQESYSQAVVNSVDEMVVNAGVAKNKDAQNSTQEIISYDLAQNRVAPEFAVKKTETVEFDLASEQEEKEGLQVSEKEETKIKQVFITNDIKKLKNSPEKTSSKNKEKSVKRSGNYFVQVGAFSRDASAKEQLAALKKYDSGLVKKVNSGKKTLYKSWLGPYASKAEANKMASKIKANGRAAIVVKN